MIKILHVIETLGNGGAERVLVNTLPKLKRMGVDCEVVMLFQKEDLKIELESRGIKVHKLNIKNRWNLIFAIEKLNHLVKKEKYEILHAHIFFAHFYTALLKLRNRNFKSVVSFHNLGYDTYPPNTIWRKIRKRIDVYLVNNFIDLRVGVSQAVKNHYKNHLSLSQIDVIHNGFPTDEIKSTVNKHKLEVFTVSNYKWIVFTGGRLVKEKGHKYLLEAVEIINRKNPNNQNDILFLIAGDGFLLSEIESKIQEKSLKNVKMLGNLNHNDLLGFLQISDLVVLPSISEGFPMIVGEAMTLGKPIITTNVGGIPDFIDNEINGVLVSPKNSLLLSDKIDELISDRKKRERLGENAAIKAMDFDINLIATKWHLVYKRLRDEN